MTAKPGVCGQNPTLPEFTLCGMAFDAYDSQDTDVPVVFAAPGETITCPDCRRFISLMRAYRTNFKQPR